MFFRVECVPKAVLNSFKEEGVAYQFPVEAFIWIITKNSLEGGDQKILYVSTENFISFERNDSYVMFRESSLIRKTIKDFFWNSTSGFQLRQRKGFPRNLRFEGGYNIHLNISLGDSKQVSTKFMTKKLTK